MTYKKGNMSDYITVCPNGINERSEYIERLSKQRGAPVAPISDELRRSIPVLGYDCPKCSGSGFSGQGTGYDAVCDNCIAGKTEHPEETNEAERTVRDLSDYDNLKLAIRNAPITWLPGLLRQTIFCLVKGKCFTDNGLKDFVDIVEREAHDPYWMLRDK